MKEKKNSVRVIKKYQNRRLYDMSTSTYVILEDVKQMIIGGEDVVVIDVKTSQDITRFVMMQIIFEEEINNNHSFSDEFLFQIIRFYGKTMQSSLEPFLEYSLDLFRRIHRKFCEQIKDSYSNDKLAGKLKLWEEFMELQGREIEENMKQHIQLNFYNFFKQKEVKDTSRNFFEYPHLPFISRKIGK